MEIFKKAQLLERYQNFIDGEWVDAENGAVLDVVCPATGEKLCEIAQSSAADVDKAQKAAAKAFESYKKTSVNERSAILRRMAQKVDENKEHLALVECLDTGKTLASAMGDVEFMVSFYNYCAGTILSYEGSAAVTNDTTMQLILREPIGVVGMIIPWNVAYIIEAWKLGPAIATGCTCVVKPSQHASLGTLEFFRIMQDVIPKGVVNIVTGSGSKAGQYILDHPGMDKLSFTGSTDIGRTVAISAAQRIIPCTLELGGKSANIVFADADREKVKSSLYAYLDNNAQVCSAGSRLLIQEDIYDEIVDMCAELYDSLKVGLPWEENVDIGSLTYKAHYEEVLEYLESGKAQGARVACGGVVPQDEKLKNGLFLRPTLLADVTNDMKVAQEEIFGPILCAIKFKDEEDAIRIANDTKYGLSGAVFSNDIGKAIRVARGVVTGRMWINSYGDISTTAAIFGGVKQSGIGREGHWRAFDYYTQIKSVVINIAK